MANKGNSKTVKTKLCWNCEGSVAKHVENCPFCGVYLSPDETLAATQSILKAPYTPSMNTVEPIPEPPYSPQEDSKESLVEKIATLPAQNQFSEIFLPVFCLSSGLVALLFALLLLLFSTHGKLVMEWDGSLWGWYACGGLLMLSLGWKFLQKHPSE